MAVTARRNPKLVCGKMSHERTEVVTLMLVQPVSASTTRVTSDSLLQGDTRKDKQSDTRRNTVIKRMEMEKKHKKKQHKTRSQEEDRKTIKDTKI